MGMNVNIWWEKVLGRNEYRHIIREDKTPTQGAIAKEQEEQYDKENNLQTLVNSVLNENLIFRVKGLIGSMC